MAPDVKISLDTLRWNKYSQTKCNNNPGLLGSLCGVLKVAYFSIVLFFPVQHTCHPTGADLQVIPHAPFNGTIYLTSNRQCMFDVNNGVYTKTGVSYTEPEENCDPVEVTQETEGGRIVSRQNVSHNLIRNVDILHSILEVHSLFFFLNCQSAVYICILQYNIVEIL